ncbi:hypothetical protein TNCV_2885351 [Trichonephila clavipes]|nr:hypothetical protein TNCV_2885351 [Trichonephila clavipes]
MVLGRANPCALLSDLNFNTRGKNDDLAVMEMNVQSNWKLGTAAVDLPYSENVETVCLNKRIKNYFPISSQSLLRIVIYTVLDESRSFFRVHTGYFSNIPKCIKAEFIASWGCSQSSVVSSSQR